MIESFSFLFSIVKMTSDDDSDSIMNDINGSQYRPATFQKLVNVSSEFTGVHSPCSSMPNQTTGSVSILVCITLDSSNLIP